MAVDFTSWRWFCPHCGRWIAERDVHDRVRFTADGPVETIDGHCTRCGDVENVTYRPIRWVDDGVEAEI